MRDGLDPKGLIREAYRIDGISAPECRSIFLDWVLSLGDVAPEAAIPELLARHADMAADHPMSVTLREGLKNAPRTGRRGGRRARIADQEG